MITKESEMINEAIGYIVTEYKKCGDQEDDEEIRSQYMDLVHAMSVSEKNPITIRYYLVNGGEYKQHRISNGTVKDDKKFYADVPYNKFREKIEDNRSYTNLSPVFAMYSNFTNGEDVF